MAIVMKLTNTNANKKPKAVEQFDDPNVIHCVTICDKAYLAKGLAMYRSLSGNFHLHWLALDTETKVILDALKLENVTIHDSDTWQRAVKPLYSKYADWCYAMTPIFTSYVMQRFDKPVLYLDADLMFYAPIEEAIKGYESCDAAFVEHRIQKYPNTGRFNVGIVLINNITAATEWASYMLDPDNKHAEEYGTCGDQKYLELIFKHHDCQILEIGHGAPWNFRFHHYTDDPSRIGYKAAEHDMIYNHFSHFNHDDNEYRVDFKGEWGNVLDIHPVIGAWYDHYWEAIKSAEAELRDIEHTI